MQLITKFRADYIIRLNNGELITVLDIEREVWFDGEGEEIYFSADECDRIDRAIEYLYPNYFQKRGKKKVCPT